MIVAFDMFGTLADTASVAAELTPACGDRAVHVAVAWRGRQLEYMFRVTAMGQFPSFADLTRWSLAAALAESAREAVLWKLDGLGECDIRRPLTPTGTNGWSAWRAKPARAEAVPARSPAASVAVPQVARQD